MHKADGSVDNQNEECKMTESQIILPSARNENFSYNVMLKMKEQRTLKKNRMNSAMQLGEKPTVVRN